MKEDTSELFILFISILISLLCLHILEKYLMNILNNKNKKVSLLQFKSYFDTINRAKIVLYILFIAIIIILINPLRLLTIFNPYILNLFGDQHKSLIEYTNKLNFCYNIDFKYIQNKPFDLYKFSKLPNEIIFNHKMEKILNRISKQFDKTTLCNLLKSIELDNIMANIEPSVLKNIFEKYYNTNTDINEILNDYKTDLNIKQINKIGEIVNMNENGNPIYLDVEHHTIFNSFNKYIHNLVIDNNVNTILPISLIVIILFIYTLIDVNCSIYYFGTTLQKFRDIQNTSKCIKIINNNYYIKNTTSNLNMYFIVFNILIIYLILQITSDSEWLNNTHIDYTGGKYVVFILFLTNVLCKILYKYNKYTTIDTYIASNIYIIISNIIIFMMLLRYVRHYTAHMIFNLNHVKDKLTKEIVNKYNKQYNKPDMLELLENDKDIYNSSMNIDPFTKEIKNTSYYKTHLFIYYPTKLKFLSFHIIMLIVLNYLALYYSNNCNNNKLPQVLNSIEIIYIIIIILLDIFGRIIRNFDVDETANYIPNQIMESIGVSVILYIFIIMGTVPKLQRTKSTTKLLYNPEILSSSSEEKEKVTLYWGNFLEPIPRYIFGTYPSTQFAIIITNYISLLVISHYWFPWYVVFSLMSIDNKELSLDIFLYSFPFYIILLYGLIIFSCIFKDKNDGNNIEPLFYTFIGFIVVSIIGYILFQIYIEDKDLIYSALKKSMTLIKSEYIVYSFILYIFILFTSFNIKTRITVYTIILLFLLIYKSIFNLKLSQLGGSSYNYNNIYIFMFISFIIYIIYYKKNNIKNNQKNLKGGQKKSEKLGLPPEYNIDSNIIQIAILIIIFIILYYLGIFYTNNIVDFINTKFLSYSNLNKLRLILFPIVILLIFFSISRFDMIKAFVIRNIEENSLSETNIASVKNNKNKKDLLKDYETFMLYKYGSLILCILWYIILIYSGKFQFDVMFIINIIVLSFYVYFVQYVVYIFYKIYINENINNIDQEIKKVNKIKTEIKFRKGRVNPAQLEEIIELDESKLKVQFEEFINTLYIDLHNILTVNNIFLTSPIKIYIKRKLITYKNLEDEFKLKTSIEENRKIELAKRRKLKNTNPLPAIPENIFMKLNLSGKWTNIKNDNNIILYVYNNVGIVLYFNKTKYQSLKLTTIVQKSNYYEFIYDNKLEFTYDNKNIIIDNIPYSKLSNEFTTDSIIKKTLRENDVFKNLNYMITIDEDSKYIGKYNIIENLTNYNYYKKQGDPISTILEQLIMNKILLIKAIKSKNYKNADMYNKLIEKLEKKYKKRKIYYKYDSNRDGIIDINEIENYKNVNTKLSEVDKIKIVSAIYDGTHLYIKFDKSIEVKISSSSNDLIITNNVDYFDAGDLIVFNYDIKDNPPAGTTPSVKVQANKTYKIYTKNTNIITLADTETSTQLTATMTTTGYTIPPNTTIKKINTTHIQLKIDNYTINANFTIIDYKIYKITFVETDKAKIEKTKNIKINQINNIDISSIHLNNRKLINPTVKLYKTINNFAEFDPTIFDP